MTRQGLVLFALMSVIWGIPYLLIRVAVAEITPATLVFARTALAAAILMPIALLRVDLRPVLRRWRWVVAFAAVEIAIPWVLLGSAEQHISSSLAGLLVAGVPLVGAAIARRDGRRGSPGADRACSACSSGWSGSPRSSAATSRRPTRSRCSRSASSSSGTRSGPPSCRAAWTACRRSGSWACRSRCAPSLYAPLAAVQWPSAVPSTEVLASIAILAVVCTAAAFMLFAALIDAIGPVRSTVITYVNPAVAAVLGVLVLGETFTPAMAIGFALVILGSALATRPARGGVAADADGNVIELAQEP